MAPMKPTHRRRRRRKPWTTTRKSRPHMDPDFHEVQEIVGEADDERGKWYLVRWVGIDPETNAPWRPDWIHECGVFAPECLERWEVEKESSLYKRSCLRITIPKRIPGRAPLSLQDDAKHAAGTNVKEDVPASTHLDGYRAGDVGIPIFYEGCSEQPKNFAMDIDQKQHRAPESHTSDAADPRPLEGDGSDSEEDVLLYPSDDGAHPLFYRHPPSQSDETELSELCQDRAETGADFVLDEFEALVPITYAPVSNTSDPPDLVGGALTPSRQGSCGASMASQVPQNFDGDLTTVIPAAAIAVQPSLSPAGHAISALPAPVIDSQPVRPSTTTEGDDHSVEVQGLPVDALQLPDESDSLLYPDEDTPDEADASSLHAITTAATTTSSDKNNDPGLGADSGAVDQHGIPIEPARTSVAERPQIHFSFGLGARGADSDPFGSSWTPPFSQHQLVA
ncbi:hypothetical protein PUNSTDRAFT_127678 [Punctularia strigosozonata HHB-11173 SS5]|uniref:uncharacterized protein n=1 Tax=Punctularia strigosozonata (strain HHB-11173) TaxID=741275 RepID=UPI000441762D|nr:uncharacterized protein PUNSTDRAFT_127678 [Punctularia strigosozonata HHB-11173 SS5]EIN05677.1 hypothetical protein PUNSTDRAFT_127678 [Punctularia strigosozonata HHB-11173 SS5]